MSGAVKNLHPLTPEQRLAVQTGENIWLSASAGSGKTQVLAARVIRLLLEPRVSPESILCITYTKAGATEMAQRINEILASWVQKKDTDIAVDLQAIDAEATPATLRRARELFAAVLDAPGGGLQIMTIHSLCQSLLASFPEEAGLLPGFAPVEGREQAELFQEALREMILDAEEDKNDWLIEQVQALALALGEDGALAFLKRCAAFPDELAELPDGLGMGVATRRFLGLDFQGDADEYLAAQCADASFDKQSLSLCADLNAQWNTKTGLKYADIIRGWLNAEVNARATGFNALASCWTKADGTHREKQVVSGDEYQALTFDLFQWTQSVQRQYLLLEYADRWSAALAVGKAYAARYETAKHARGHVDFGDMIRRTAALLDEPGMAQWIRYKLDRRIDHILVDEAQDSNPAQWRIAHALSDDFWSEDPEEEGTKDRTIFAVGDYKQAIYGFQGTDPESYVAAGNSFAERLELAGRELHRQPLAQSFRSNRPVMDIVNAVIKAQGPEAMGIKDEIEKHWSALPNVGIIELFGHVSASTDDDEGGDNYISDEKRELASRIAEHIRDLIDAAPLLQSTGRPLRPGDIMILLRSRSSLASALVSQLHQKKVAVAGVDRLQLQQPLAVQDLLSALRFVLQPEDDHSLACLLVSPLIGWDHERLLQHGYRQPDPKTKRPLVSLWEHIRGQAELATDIEPLRIMLGMADLTTAYQFFEQLLSGAVGGRRKLQERLGSEALVPVEELLNAALQFEQVHGGTLQHFLAWFERDDSEIKREGVAGNDEVRVMTVHGAKGLQAPVVILADAAAAPEAARRDAPDFETESGKMLPLPGLTKDYRIGKLADLAEHAEQRDMEEFFRLLYVALTRAQERLIVTGSLGKNRKEIRESSWYAAVRAGMEELGCEWQDDVRWGKHMRHEGAEAAVAKVEPAAMAPIAESEIPSWLFEPAPDEQRPPRPLAPSKIDDDDYGDAPASAAMRAAAERGTLIHALFERIGVDGDLAAVRRWLDNAVRDLALDKEELLECIRAVVEHPDYGDFFGQNARSEVPLAAVVGEIVVSGRIDRLIVEPGLVRLLDFKTGRGVPSGEGSVPVPYLRQMAHYVAALEVIFPEKKVEASLLFTHAPKLLTLSDQVLAPYKPVS